MKTSELLQWLKENYWEFENDKIYIDVLETLKVNKHKQEIIFLERDFDFEDGFELIEKAVEYTKTPLEDREEPKRYYLRPKGMKLIRTNFVFNYHVNDGDWILYGKDETRLTKTRFTLKELEGLGIDVEHYDLEEVEHEDGSMGEVFPADLKRVRK